MAQVQLFKNWSRKRECCRNIGNHSKSNVRLSPIQANILSSCSSWLLLDSSSQRRVCKVWTFPAAPLHMFGRERSSRQRFSKEWTGWPLSHSTPLLSAAYLRIYVYHVLCALLTAGVKGLLCLQTARSFEPRTLRLRFGVLTSYRPLRQNPTYDLLLRK